MNSDSALTQCLSFINCQLKESKVPVGHYEDVPRAAVTISRQTGSGAHAVAERLAALLQKQLPSENCPWTVFDRNLVEKTLEEANLPQRLARFIPEDRVGELSDMMDELCGLHPRSEALVRKVSDTILHLAELGNVIIIGRGANVIAARLNHVLHVRLVGSVARRLERVEEFYRLDPKQARAYMQKEDTGRTRYLKKYFGKNIEDPLLYHLVINTDLVGYEEAAQLVADELERRVRTPAGLAAAAP